MYCNCREKEENKIKSNHVTKESRKNESERFNKHVAQNNKKKTMIIDTRDKGQERMMREKKEYDISERNTRSRKKKNC